MNNQDYALATLRQEAAAPDPKPYTVAALHGAAYIWVSINENIGWHYAGIKDGVLVSIRGEAFPRPSPIESTEDARKLNYMTKWVSPKQAAKIVWAIKQFYNEQNTSL